MHSLKKIFIVLSVTLIIGLIIPASVLALFTNGGFEAGDFSSWTKSTFLNPGLIGSPPFDGTDIVRNPGGTDYSVVFGPFAAMSQTDPQTNNLLHYPAYGSYSARVNGPLGNGQNANAIVQQTTVAAGDVDPLDGLVHVRFVYAPVLEEPGHPAEAQAWMYIVVRNITKSTILYEEFIFAGQAGVPWQNGSGGSWQFVDWTMVDVAPGAGSLDVGDTVEIEAIGAGCAYGAHAGYVHVDEFGSSIPGVTVVGTGPADTYQDADLTYNFLYRNTGTGNADNVVVQVPMPPQTTYVSVSDTTNCAYAGGTVTCNFGTMAAGASGNFSVVVHVALGASGSIVNGLYNIGATGMPTLLGPKITTNVLPQAPTVTTLGSSLNPSEWGQLVTLTAGVTGGPTPTGSVSFYDGAVLLGTVTLDGSGQATLDVPLFSIGTHTLTAVYNPDATHLGSTSAPLDQVVTKASTTTGLVMAPNPSVYGQPMQFVATIGDNAPGDPSGTVTFQADGVDIPGCVNVPIVGGQAVCDPGVFNAGDYVITAIYNGDAFFFGSISGGQVQTIEKADTTATVVSSANPSMYGELVSFRATVTTDLPGMGVPVGTVSFYDGSTLLQTIPLDGSGVAEFTTVYPLAVGVHNIHAVYNGNANFNGSDAALQQRVDWATDLTIEKWSTNAHLSSVDFVIVARNRSCCCIAAPGSVISDTLAPYYANATWTCEASGGAHCGTLSGVGSIYDTLGAFPPGGVVTYTMHTEYTLPQAGYIMNSAEIIPPVGVSDIDLTNNFVTIRRYFLLLPIIARDFTP